MKIEKLVKVVGKDLCEKPIYYDFPLNFLPKNIDTISYALGCANTVSGQHLNMSDISIKVYKRYIRDSI